MPRRPRHVSSILAPALCLLFVGCPGEEPTPADGAATVGTAAGDAAAGSTGATGGTAPDAVTPVPGAAVVRPPFPLGTWRLLVNNDQQPGGMANFGTVTVAGRDGNYAAKFAPGPALPREGGPTMDGIRVDGDALSLTFALPPDIDIDTFRFDGVRDGGVIYGTLSAGLDVSLAKLVPRGIGEPDGPAQVASENLPALQQVLQANPQTPDAAVAELARTAPRTEAVWPVALGLLRAARQRGVDGATVEDLAGGLTAMAGSWGPRAESAARLQVAMALFGQGMFVDLAEENAAAALAALPESERAAWEEAVESGRVRAGQVALAERAQGLYEGGVADPAGALAGLRELRAEHPDEAMLAVALAEAERDFGGPGAVGRLEVLVEETEGLTPVRYVLAETQLDRGDRRAGRELLTELVRDRDTLGQIVGTLGRRPGFVPPTRRLVEAYAGRDRQFAELFEPTTAFAGGPREPLPGNRTVLLELFTGAGCGTCVPADLAFSGLRRTLSPTDAVVLQYRLHIPPEDPTARPAADPLANPAAERRADYYTVSKPPGAFINGEQSTPLGGGPDDAELRFASLLDAVEPLAEEDTPVTLDLSVEPTDAGLKITAAADGREFGGSVRLRLALAERIVPYAAANGLMVHEMVVRDMPGGADGIVPAGDALRFEGTVDVAAVRDELAAYLDRYATQRNAPFDSRPLALDDLTVVAWVQDDATKEVLQATAVDVAAARSSESDTPALDRSPAAPAEAPRPKPAGDPDGPRAPAEAAKPVAGGVSDEET